MRKVSIIIVLLAVGLRITLAQNGYNYDRPDVNLGGGGSRPPTGSGYQPAQAGNYPTTPTYAAPSFSPNQPTGSGQSGYNYPQADTDFPTGSSSGTTGYPSGPQRPSNAGASSYGPPAVGGPQGGFAAQRPGATGFGQSPAGFGPGSVAGGAFPGGAIPGQSSSSSSSQSGSGQQDESQEGDYSAIPGEPDVDYPIYAEIPETSFDCNQQEYPGYYADVEARCQVFHICALNKTFNFLCPNGTIFSQETLVCVWWNQFDCNSAPGLFANNANLYENPQQGSQAGGQGAIANDFAAAVGPTGPYPAQGRPQTPGFGGSAPTGPNSYQPSAPGGNYPAAGAQGGNYPAAGAQAGSYQPPQLVPSAPQGPYPSSQIPPSNVPSSYQPPQGDSPYPASGNPQTQTTPSRDYLPPRRG